MTIQMKATEQYFPVVLFIMLYKVVPRDFSLWMKSLINGVSVVVNFFTSGNFCFFVFRYGNEVATKEK